MVVKLQGGIVWKITCIVVLLLGLYLGGCGNVDLEEAQANYVNAMDRFCTRSMSIRNAHHVASKRNLTLTTHC